MHWPLVPVPAVLAIVLHDPDALRLEVRAVDCDGAPVVPRDSGHHVVEIGGL